MTKPRNLNLISVALLLIITSWARAQQYPPVPSELIWAVPYGPSIQLLSDTAFANGFRAYWSCSDTDWLAKLRVGPCSNYYTPYVNNYGKAYAIRTWPDIGAPNDSNKFWNFNEGAHSNVVVDGYSIPAGVDLAVNRFEANAACYSDPSVIWLASVNNLSSGDPSSSPHYNPYYGNTVRSAQSDRNGTLLTYANTRNEIRNAAIDNGPAWASDTWPHFLVEQNFKQFIDLATLADAVLNLNLRVWPVNFMTNTIPNSYFSDATYNIYFVLRRKNDPSKVLYLGYAPYSTNTYTSEGSAGAYL